MRASRYLIATLREVPQDAIVTSHRLMLRAGLIRKQGAGLYHLLPLGLRTFRKIETIIREEMDHAGALEFQLPILTPAELWQRSGRWEAMGKEMFRLQDRHNTANALGPTHEESFTDLMRGILKSHRDLPINVYQIHTKFRDEIRPRFGVIRGREFCMKDAYSFDLNDAGLDAAYQNMRTAYRKIFDRMGLHTIPVEADTGAMGGSGSEEFMVPSEVGEETLLISENETYRGNQEKTAVVYPPATETNETVELKKVHTPACPTIADLEKFLKVDARAILKTMLYMADGSPVAVCLRGDRQLNEIKLKNHLDAIELEPATDAQMRERNIAVGYIGPRGLDPAIPILFDNSLQNGSNWVIGANETEYHCTGYTPEKLDETHDFALAVAGDPAPNGDGVLRSVKGLEVGHIFKLGDKYTKAFELTVLDENGKAATPLMGCYGIGLNRSMAAIIEQNHDDKGVHWPIAVAPFEIVLIGIGKTPADEERIAALYEALLAAGCDLIWDDRKLRPGVKFNDADLIGYPLRITAGKTFLEKNSLELRLRAGQKDSQIDGTLAEMVEQIVRIRDGLAKNGGSSD